MLTKERAADLISELRAISAEPGNPVDALLKMRHVLVDAPISDFAPWVEPRVLTALYQTRALLGDIFVNLGTDATMPLSQLESELEAIGESLARFIQSTTTATGDDGEAWQLLSETIGKYCSVLHGLQGDGLQDAA